MTLPAKAADELVGYNISTGLFDISYAAAWELGRLLALQSKQFSVDLYNWKRAHAQQVKQAEQQLLYPNLAVQGQSNGTVELPEQVTRWFNNLSIFEDVPFNYRVPDERMLPAESIRFFCVNGLWIDCLLDGAYSIGRVTTSDYELDQSQTDSPASQNTSLILESVPWRDQSKGVLDIQSMAQQIQDHLDLESFTSAELALQMIGGVEMVAFEKVRST